jgi:hypothetical protein
MPPTRPSPLGDAVRGAFRLERPPPSTPAVQRLRRLILVTAGATVLVDLINLEYAAEAGFGLVVRTVWALLRAIGFLFLMREVRFGRGAARPLGLILAATTVFASARLVQPRQRSYLPEWPVIGGVVLLTVLCGLIVWRLFRSGEVADHLSHRPARRSLSGWVVTARVAALTYGPLLLVPGLVALGTLFDEPRLPMRSAVPLVLVWLTGAFVLTLVTSLVSFLTLFGKRWARCLLAAIGVLVLVLQPALCWLLLGLDGLIRDGLPMLVAAGLGLYALYRSRLKGGSPS